MSFDVAMASALSLPTAALADTIADPPQIGSRIAEAETLIRMLLCTEGTDDVVHARLEASVDECVDMWTPTVHTTTRFDLAAVLADHDDAIGDVSLSITESAASRSRALLAWQAAGRFERPAFLDDDHLLEPNGAVVRLAGATSVSFTPGGRALRIRCYYDRLSLIEQMMAPIQT